MIRKEYEYYKCPFCGKKLHYTDVHRTEDGWCIEYPRCDCIPEEELKYTGICLELSHDPRIMKIENFSTEAEK